MVLEELRILHLDMQAAERGRLSGGDLKAHPQGNTLSPTKGTPSPTRPHLLMVPFLMNQAFKHKSLWGPNLFEPPTVTICEQEVTVPRDLNHVRHSRTSFSKPYLCLDTLLRSH